MNTMEQHTQHCRQLVADWMACRPTYDNAGGLTAVWMDIVARMQGIGFAVQRIDNPDAPHRPLLICRRTAAGDDRATIGFFGHYDVEPVPEPEQWDTDPWTLTDKDGRWYGRGTGDNLLPLAQRLLVLGQAFAEVNLCYVLQGEEEMLGPFAHKVYPNLDLGEIHLWMEETGYFDKSGAQRILTLHADEPLQQLVGHLDDIAEADGRTVRYEERTLNKAFGGRQCPCHEHLLGNTPYLAIGPNDDDCAIHAVNESMDPALLEISARQLAAVSDWGAAL